MGLSQVVVVILGGWRGVGWVCGKQWMVNFAEVFYRRREGEDGFWVLSCVHVCSGLLMCCRPLDGKRGRGFCCGGKATEDGRRRCGLWRELQVNGRGLRRL